MSILEGGLNSLDSKFNRVPPLGFLPKSGKGGLNSRNAPDSRFEKKGMNRTLRLKPVQMPFGKNRENPYTHANTLKFLRSWGTRLGSPPPISGFFQDWIHEIRILCHTHAKTCSFLQIIDYNDFLEDFKQNPPLEKSSKPLFGDISPWPGAPVLIRRGVACEPHFQAGERYRSPRRWCKKM